MLPLAEQAVAVVGDQTIQEIAQRQGNQAQRGHERPVRVEVTENAEHRIGSDVGLAVFDEHDAVGCAARSGIMAGEEQTPRFALQRGIAEMPFPVSPDDESDRPVAKVAHPVKEDDRPRKFLVNRYAVGQFHLLLCGKAWPPFGVRTGTRAENGGFRAVRPDYSFISPYLVSTVTSAAAQTALGSVVVVTSA